MKRRTVLQWAAAGAGVWGCGGGAGNQAPEGSPNILMIAVDDLNDWVGYLGAHPQVQTPGIDALAATSNAFLKAFSLAPLCSPSRATVLSGLSVQHTGVYDNEHTFRLVNSGKAEFDDMLSGAGWDVARFGKVDHSYSSYASQPLPPTMPYANKDCPAPLGEGAFDWWPSTAADEDHPDWHYAQSGIDYLNSHDTSKPFCLSVGFVRTHVGWYVPQRFFDLYPLDQVQVPSPPADDLDDLGTTGKSIALEYKFHQCITGQNLWASAVQAYLASISWVDTQVARLIAALDASAHAKNTMVVLWSDHGFHLGEKFHWHKTALWDPATHVPCLIRMPGQTTGQTLSQVVGLNHLVPTILDVCGVTPTYTLDGISLKSLIADSTQAWDRPVLTTLNENHYAVRTERWRYIRYASGEKELYDMTADPTEHRNLVYTAEGLTAYAEVVAALDAYMPTT
jgi:arylsulfatase A-like enzyme